MNITITAAIKLFSARQITGMSRQQIHKPVHARRMIARRFAFHEFANQRDDVFLFFARIAEEGIHCLL